jgi:pyridoxine 4-dehydrogenase
MYTDDPRCKLGAVQTQKSGAVVRFPSMVGPEGLEFGAHLLLERAQQFAARLFLPSKVDGGGGSKSPRFAHQTVCFAADCVGSIQCYSFRTRSPKPVIKNAAMIKVTKTFRIGNDLEVNRLGFGAMRLTGAGIWGEPKDPDEARQVLKRAVELGVDFIDTADSYGPDVSERLIGETLSPFPKGLVVATKGGLTRQGPDRWSPDGRPDYLATEVEKSLRLLKTDVIDLWQLHRIDPKVSVEQSLEPIVKLKQQGKIRHIGLSEVKPRDIERARKVVEIVSVQNLYNVGDRQHEDVLEYCERHNIAFIPWFPVAAGKLARPGGKLDEVAKRHGATVAQLSIAWLLHRSPVMLPIPGTSSVVHLQENMKAAHIELSEAEMKEIEKAAKS